MAVLLRIAPRCNRAGIHVIQGGEDVKFNSAREYPDALYLKRRTIAQTIEQAIFTPAALQSAIA